MTIIQRDHETTKPGIAVQIYRPGYKPSLVVLQHDAENFHCYFHFTASGARQLGEAIISMANEAENALDPDTEAEIRIANLRIANSQKLAADADLVDACFTALPFVEDALEDPAYKPGNVTSALNKLRGALRKAGAL